MTKAKYWYNSSQNIEPNWPKIDEDGEKCRKLNLDLSQFFAILRHFKGYQTALGICRMARGVPLISINDQDFILVQYKSKN